MANSLPPTRQETDSLGAIAVPSDRYWGAQTQRSIRYFSIGQDKMPLEVVHAIAIAKKASALANADLGKLPTDKATLIVQAADEIIAGQLDDHFPLHVWMTGSGTQCNMNVNEVIANRAIELAGGEMGSKTPIHPNDHVNMSQSSNDIFPTAMHIAAAQALTQRLRPAVTQLRDALDEKAQAWADIVKIGRTHLQDAVPLTLGQEFSGYVGMLDDNLTRLESALPGLYQLAIGGTALGTGLNAGPGFAEAAAQHIAHLTELPFVSALNKFTVMGAHDAVVMASGVLKTLAVSLYKIANDIRLLSCGPRAGFAELHLPENEPGSSIMPGKVNPTQCEALAMVAVQVMGYDAAVAFAGASGYLDMNVYKPMMIFNLLQSARLMADSCHNFTEFLVAGMTPNYKQIDQYVQQSLMLVTALSPAIGYDKASQIAHHAFEHDLTLKQAALALGYVSEAEFDTLIDPRRMTHP
ncbi:class II fumarate hydratase [Nodosilinea sp. LEGE 07298]|uniref:class II fumarate hydratase n=1 Tax=Nodosilinea sp. LEGE 07298 TaxID=2777970 RepID=UPI001882656D|nr:class II fumarate hydratase [Nodosilinea sp. LEGE 07298]MBE9110146.1 class II fumarate hydratase [Nodosilinea sp. LEGE 07298]